MSNQQPISFVEWIELKKADIKSHIAEEKNESIRLALIEFYSGLVLVQTRLNAVTEYESDALVKIMRFIYCEHCGKIGSNSRIGVK